MQLINELDTHEANITKLLKVTITGLVIHLWCPDYRICIRLKDNLAHSYTKQIDQDYETEPRAIHPHVKPIGDLNEAKNDSILSRLGSHAKLIEIAFSNF